VKPVLGEACLCGFGSFSIKQRNARIGHNPRNGKAVSVEAKAVPYFRASREMLGRLNLRRRRGHHRQARRRTASCHLDRRATRSRPVPGTSQRRLANGLPSDRNQQQR
jgi:hypothetical protein